MAVHHAELLDLVRVSLINSAALGIYSSKFKSSLNRVQLDHECVICLGTVWIMSFYRVFFGIFI